MYYEEKIIDGVLYSRSSPNGIFTPVSEAKLNSVVCTLKSEVDALRAENEMLRSKVQTVRRDDIMNVLKSRIDAEMCDMAEEYDIEHGDVEPMWVVQYDDLMMNLANLMCTWITDNKPNAIVEF